MLPAIQGVGGELFSHDMTVPPLFLTSKYLLFLFALPAICDVQRTVRAKVQTERQSPRIEEETPTSATGLGTLRSVSCSRRCCYCCRAFRRWAMGKVFFGRGLKQQRDGPFAFALYCCPCSVVLVLLSLPFLFVCRCDSQRSSESTTPEKEQIPVVLILTVRLQCLCFEFLVTSVVACVTCHVSLPMPFSLFAPRGPSAFHPAV